MTERLKPGNIARRLHTPNVGPWTSGDPHSPDRPRVEPGDLVQIDRVAGDGYYDTRGIWHRGNHLEFVAPAPRPDTPKTKRAVILAEADRIIHGDREKDYGAPIDSFTRLAAALALVFGHEVTPVQAAAAMIAMKLSRLAGGDYKDDTWVDLAGYAALGAEVRDQQ